jgi:hypothetical protein
MTWFLLGALLGFSIGYPFGLFIDKVDKWQKKKTR